MCICLHVSVFCLAQTDLSGCGTESGGHSFDHRVFQRERDGWREGWRERERDGERDRGMESEGWMDGERDGSRGGEMEESGTGQRNMSADGCHGAF